MAPRTPDAPLPIPVKDRRQAMDWSLALASQGIAATIMHDAERDAWSLGVEAPDRERAIATLKRYHVENKGWHWEQPLPWTGMLFHWGSVLWCAWLAFVHGLYVNGAERLRTQGIMDGVLVNHGEWWRLFTAQMLHGDGSHLSSNLVSGLVLFGLVMARFGAGLGLCAAALAGSCGFLTGWLVYPQDYRALGASGMVTGALGLLAAESLRQWRAGAVGKRTAWAALAAGAMLFLLIGSDPASDLVAHAGGFAGGCMLGALLGQVPERILNEPKVKLLAMAVFLSGVAMVWAIALRA